MKCLLCGAENPAGADRCRGCGFLISDGQLPVATPGDDDRTILETPLAAVTDEESNGGGERKTRVVEIPDAPAPDPRGRPDAIGPAPSPPATAVPTAAPATGARPPGRGTGEPHRRTTMLPSPGARETDGEPTPRLVGFLVSYSWDPAGAWAPIREGRLVVGVGPAADLRVEGDTAVSDAHFSVHARGGKVLIKDPVSTNGTVVDGQELWGNHAPAAHGSSIRAGNTVFTLLMVPEKGAMD